LIKIHLSRILGEHRLTQAELARKTGIRPSTIGDYYHELSDRINLNHFDLLCETLNCSISDLLEYIPKKNETKNHNKIIMTTPSKGGLGEAQ
jgi:putative transcriptional regulator